MRATEPAGTPCLSPEEEARCQSFCRWKLWLDLAEALTVLGLLCGLSLSGASRVLLTGIGGLPLPRPLTTGLYLLALGLIVQLSRLPFHFASECWLERRFGLARQSSLAWLAEWLGLSLLRGALILALLWPVALTLPWWPYLLWLWAIAYLGLRRLYQDCLYYSLLRCFYPVRFLRRETFALPGIGRITLPVFVVTVSHRTARVAASIHLRGRRSAIYVTDTLLQAFTAAEERIAMAHEFGHLWDRLHLEEKTLAGVRQAARKAVLGALQFASALMVLVLLELEGPLLGLRGAADLAGFPLLAALCLGMARVWSPLACAEARRDEAEADRFALCVTGDPESYLSMLTKLRRINLDELGSNPLSRLLFDTHPSYEERAQLAGQIRPFPARRVRRGPHRHRGVRRPKR